MLTPFNIYLRLSLNKREKKRFYLAGITENNQRELFDAALKIGICKIDTKCDNFRSLCSNALMTFAREDDITEEEYAFLNQQLQKIGITISKNTI